MESLNNILKKSLNKEFLSAIISNPREKGGIVKIKIRPVEHKDNILYQCEEHRNNQVFHHNLNEEEAAGYIENAMQEFKQMQMETRKFRYQVLVSKKGKMTVRKKQRSVSEDNVKVSLSHNRKKRYILEEGRPVPFLVDLGVQTKEGKVITSRYDKFRQINRFIEMVDDVLKTYKGDEINIIDFGCGKSYLTFFLYYYIVEIRHMTAHITGLDLKEQVIKNCNKLAEKCGYTDLKFKIGDINGYRTDRKVDMVVTLHACDTATDYALYNAICWNTTYILSVPCCQHELNKQIRSEELSALTKYGIIKERTAALMTDAIRGCMLEYCGYKTDLLEFIDIEHSPKNILIRAVKKPVSEEKRERAKAEAERLCRTFGIHQTLMQLVLTEERSHS